MNGTTSAGEGDGFKKSPPSASTSCSSNFSVSSCYLGSNYNLTEANAGIEIRLVNDKVV